MFKKLGIGLLGVLVGLIALIASRPADFRLERKTKIDAPVAVTFGLVNDFHSWDVWSPWAKIDPAMKVTHSGPERGQGAVYEWTGNSEVGQGRMEILSARENEEVKIDLHFIAPFEAKNLTTFTFVPQGNGVEVIWAMAGTNNFMAKAFDLFVGMEKQVGPDFEKGLAQLKQAAEQKAKAGV